MVYTPFICEIGDITTGETTLIETTTDHAFVVGNYVQLFIPSNYGAQQINRSKGYVTATTSDTVTVTIDSRICDAFTIPTPPAYVVYQIPQIAPIGDSNTGYLSDGNVPPEEQTIPGAFAPPES